MANHFLKLSRSRLQQHKTKNGSVAALKTKSSQPYVVELMLTNPCMAPMKVMNPIAKTPKVTEKHQQHVLRRPVNGIPYIKVVG